MIVKAKKGIGIETKRHSFAHILAMAILELYPEAKLGIGPAIENGFYYDFDFGASKVSDDSLIKIEKKMRELLAKDLKFKKEKIDFLEAKKILKSQPYKLELIKDLNKAGERITIYKTYLDSNPNTQNLKPYFLDLCAGPHISSTHELNSDAFKLTKIAGAYWKGSEKNPQLTRIYGIAFNSKQEVEDYEKILEEAERRDHRKIGKEMGLFAFSDLIGKGLPLWTEKGAAIIRELENFIINEEIKRGYKHVRTPDIAKLDLYKKSGHYPYYKDSMYAPIKIDDEEFMLRPMSCPHHFELYLSKPRSYKELPFRIAEIAKLYRYEQSGELSGLIRVRSFCLADAHIICADKNQAGEEIEKVLDLIEFVLDKFGLKANENFWYRLSLGDRKDDKKYYKNDKAWDDAESILKSLLKNRKCRFVEAKGEAAFYGPKIDIQMKNILGKEDTAFTVQYDFVMPERFNLIYIDKDGKEKKTVVVHRSSIGAIERTLAFLIEYYAGALPFWLMPTQIAVLSINDKEENVKYYNFIVNKLEENNIRVLLDDRNESIGRKIREAEMQKIPYILIVGDKEMEAKTVSVRERGKGDLGVMRIEGFLNLLPKKPY